MFNLVKFAVGYFTTLGDDETTSKDQPWTNISNSRVIEVTTLGQFHNLDLSNSRVLDVTTLGQFHNLAFDSNRVTYASTSGAVDFADLNGAAE